MKRKIAELKIFGYVVGNDFYNVDSPSLSDLMKQSAIPIIRLSDVSLFKQKEFKSSEKAFKEYKEKYLDISNKHEYIRAEYDFKKGFEYCQNLTDMGDRENEMYLNMQYYMEHCERFGYVTPKEWIEKHKHF